MLAYLGDAEDRGAMLALKTPAPRRAGAPRRLRGAQRPDGRRMPRPGEQRRPARAERGAAASRAIPAQARAAELLREGNYYSLTRQRAVLAAGLSGARARRPRRACDARPRRPGALRARRGMGRRIDYHVDPKRAERFYAAIRHYWPGAARRRACARLRRHPAEDRGTGRAGAGLRDSGTARRTASRAWCICSASSRRG